MSGRPKRAPKRSKKYDEDDFEEDPSDLSEEVPLDDDESTEPDSEDEKPKKKRKAPPPRAKKQVQAFIEETGWSFQPPSLLYKAYGDPAPSNKIAAFDLDGTLANQKSNAQFPKDQHDYKLYNDKVIDKLLEYQRAGYKVVVFTNQGSIKTAVTGKQAAKIKARIDNIMAELGIDAQVFAATIPDPSDPYRKPATGMWDFMCLNCNGGLQPDKSQCIYVGDAAGRAGDFAASDKQFAHNAGLAFHTPEEIFGDIKGKRHVVAKAEKDEEGNVAASVSDNSGLAAAFMKLADHYAARSKMGGEENSKAHFAAATYRKLSGVIANWNVTITKANFKQLGTVQGVGKASVAKIEKYLNTGTFDELEGIDEFAGVGKKAPQMQDAGAAYANAFM